MFFYFHFPWSQKNTWRRYFISIFNPYLGIESSLPLPSRMHPGPLPARGADNSLQRRHTRRLFFSVRLASSWKSIWGSYQDRFFCRWANAGGSSWPLFLGVPAFYPFTKGGWSRSDPSPQGLKTVLHGSPHPPPPARPRCTQPDPRLRPRRTHSLCNVVTQWIVVAAALPSHHLKNRNDQIFTLPKFVFPNFVLWKVFLPPCTGMIKRRKGGTQITPPQGF